MVLIAYDGSESAQRVLAVAGALLRGRAAHVVYVWEPVAQPMVLAVGFPQDVEAAEDGRAHEVVAEGVRLAQQAGFVADGETVRSSDPACALQDLAERLEPELLVVGTRGLHGLKRLLKGSVSDRVSTHVHVPVLIVPEDHAEQ
jgi:nucleotide-binding universal stress UspA family protein